MKFTAPHVRLKGLTLSAPVGFKNIQLGVVIVCFAFLPLSESRAQSPPSSCAGYSWCNNGAGSYVAPRYVAPQPYVPPPPSPAQIAAQRAHELNDAGNRAYTARNFAGAVTLYEQALRLTPNDAVIANNLKNAHGEVLNDEGIAAARAGNSSLALRLQEQAARLNPNDAVIANNVRMDRAVIINDEGVTAFQAGNFAHAVELYEQASRLDPNNTTIADNLHVVRAKLAQQGQDQIATAVMQRAVEKLADSVADGPSSGGSGLDFTSGGPTPASGSATGGNAPPGSTASPGAGNNSNGSLDFIGPAQGNHAGQLGTSLAINPDIGPAEPTTKTTYDSASAQADAATKDNGPNLVFDGRPGGPQGKSLVVPGAIPASAAASSLVSHLSEHKELMDNKVIAPRLQWYLSLDKLVTDKQAQIAAIQRDIDSGRGDAKILNVKKGTLENEVKLSKADQDATEKQIKDQVAKEHYTINWQDAAPANAERPSPQTTTNQPAPQ